MNLDGSPGSHKRCSGLLMRRVVAISRNRTKLARLLDLKNFTSKTFGRFTFQCLTDTLGDRSCDSVYKYVKRKHLTFEYGIKTCVFTGIPINYWFVGSPYHVIDYTCNENR